MLPGWGATKSTAIHANKENIRNAPNAQSATQTIIPPEELFSQAREYEMQYKTFSYHVSKYIKQVLKTVHEVNAHRIWSGEDGVLPIDSIEDKLHDLHDEYGLREEILQLVQNINRYVELSRETYAKQLIEMQMNHKKLMEESYSTSHIQHGKMMNDMKTAIETLTKDKSKLEQQQKAQKAQFEKQIKDLQDSKAAVSADLEGKVKTLRHQIESALKTHRDELLKEKNSVKEADDRLRQRSTEVERKAAAFARKLVSIARTVPLFMLLTCS